MEAGRGNKEKLVMIHGFGATGVFYFKMISQLKNYFNVFVIDQFGTGLSSRPDFDKEGFEEVQNFFCDAIEEWRQKLEIDNFSIVGHSFGGLTAARYFISKMPKIKKIFLVSPAGFTFKTKKEVFSSMAERMKDRIGKIPGLTSLALKIYETFFNLGQKHRLCPHQIANIVNRQTLIKRFFSGERLGFTKRESKLFGEYYYLITEMKYSGDKGTGALTHFARYSTKPLVEDFKKLQDQGKLPETYVYYGKVDWMDREHSKEVLDQSGLDIVFEVIENAGHQLTLKTPIELCRRIVGAFGLEFVIQETSDLLDENFKIVVK